MRKSVLIVLLVAVLIVAVGGWAWYSQRDRELSEKPIRGGVAEANTSSSTSVQIRADIQYAAIADLLSRNVPPSMAGSGRNRVCSDLNEEVQQTVQRTIKGSLGKLLGSFTKIVFQVVTVNQVRHVCADVDYNCDVERDGPIVVSGSPAGLHLELPVSATGGAGFSGDLAKALGMSHKNFRGSLVAIADATLGLDTNWCPVLNANVRFEWRNKAQLEIIHNVWLNIDGAVGPQISKAMTDALNKAKATLTCGMVRQKVGAIWHPYSEQLKVPGGGPDVALNFLPEKAAFSGVSYGSAAASLAVGITGTADVAMSPSPAGASLPIPSLDKIPVTSDRFSLAVPIRASWVDLSKEVTSQVVGRVFEANSAIGHASVIIDKIEVYPSGQQIALAVHLAANLPGRWLNTKGWLYLTATPVLDPATQTLRATDLHLTRGLDNQTVAAILAVLHGPIESYLQHLAFFDLKPGIQHGRVSLAAALGRFAETQKIVVLIKDDFAGMRSVQVDDQFLTANVGVDGTADVGVNGLMIASVH